MEEPGARVGGRGAVEMGEVGSRGGGGGGWDGCVWGSRGMVRVQAEVVLLVEQG